MACLPVGLLRTAHESDALIYPREQRRQDKERAHASAGVRSSSSEVRSAAVMYSLTMSWITSRVRRMLFIRPMIWPTGVPMSCWPPEPAALALRLTRLCASAFSMYWSGICSAPGESGPSQASVQGVRVNTVAPGYIWADTLQAYFAHLAKERGVSPQQVYDETAADIDLRKLPEPDEIADAVVFLASDLARAITGQCLDVNGGEFHH